MILDRNGAALFYWESRGPKPSERAGEWGLMASQDGPIARYVLVPLLLVPCNFSTGTWQAKRTAKPSASVRVYFPYLHLRGQRQVTCLLDNRLGMLRQALASRALLLPSQSPDTLSQPTTTTLTTGNKPACEQLILYSQSLKFHFDFPQLGNLTISYLQPRQTKYRKNRQVVQLQNNPPHSK